MRAGPASSSLLRRAGAAAGPHGPVPPRAAPVSVQTLFSLLDGALRKRGRLALHTTLLSEGVGGRDGTRLGLVSLNWLEFSVDASDGLFPQFLSQAKLKQTMQLSCGWV